MRRLSEGGVANGANALFHYLRIRRRFPLMTRHNRQQTPLAARLKAEIWRRARPPASCTQTDGKVWKIKIPFFGPSRSFWLGIGRLMERGEQTSAHVAISI